MYQIRLVEKVKPGSWATGSPFDWRFTAGYSARASGGMEGKPGNVN